MESPNLDKSRKLRELEDGFPSCTSLNENTLHNKNMKLQFDSGKKLVDNNLSGAHVYF